ncbi:MAG: beta-lactamase family protein [Oscillospiraceae bacterium]|nr:beta-lactamase family protein [Oscillospiraceae bacterium]
MHKLSPELQAFIEQACRGKTHIKLTVGTLIDGEQTIQTFGANGEIPNENDVYEIGSITKTFTASLLAKYISEGKLSLDDSIANYVDGLDDSYYPSLKRLATHTAGYGYLPATIWVGMKMLLLPALLGSRNGGVLPDCLRVDEKRMKSLLLENKKEDKDYPWAYSNFGMGLVGYALGQVSGRGYFDTMDDFLTQELEMPNSYTGINPDKNLHGFSKKNKDIGNWDFEKTIMSSAGDISATAEDMLTYAHKHMNEELPYLARTHQNYTTVRKSKSQSGLAWIMTGENNQVIMHNGGTGAFDSLLVIDKQKKLAYVVLSNYLINQPKLVAAVLNEAEKSRLAV